MPLIPKSNAGRVLASLWLASCFGLLVFAYVQREIHDMPVAFTWLLIFLSFPLCFLAIMVDVKVIEPMLTTAGLSYDPFLSLLPGWIGMVVLGYFQWFVALPTVVRRLFGDKHGT